MSLATRQVPASRKLVLASGHDRRIIDDSPIGHLVRYLDPAFSVRTVLRDCFPLVAVAFSDEAEADLKEIQTAMQRLKTVPSVALHRLDARDSVAALELLAALLGGGVGRLASFSASVAAELALLRRERESLLENYRALEDAFQARNWEPLAECFAHDPYVDPKDEGIGQLLASGHVDQLLPVSSHGVAGLSLHFHSVPKSGGELILTLGYVESDEGIAEWRVDYRDLVPEWNFFSLPRACGGGAKTLRLRVSTRGAETIGLSLGYPIASERYTTRSDIEHSDLDLRPLAFRIYTGVPGVAPVMTPNMIAPTSLPNGAAVQDYLLPVDILKRVIDVSVSDIVPEFETISFLEHEHALVCHPLPTGITAGAISGAVEQGTMSFSANAIIDHPEGAPAAVGFLLAPADANQRSKIAEIGRDETAGPSAFFSGWREVGPDRPISISMQLDEPLSGPMDLMILSRAVGDTVDFSWLKVSGFRLVKQSGAAAKGAIHVQ